METKNKLKQIMSLKKLYEVSKWASSLFLKSKKQIFLIVFIIVILI